MDFFFSFLFYCLLAQVEDTLTSLVGRVFVALERALAFRLPLTAVIACGSQSRCDAICPRSIETTDRVCPSKLGKVSSVFGLFPVWNRGAGAGGGGGRAGGARGGGKNESWLAEETDGGSDGKAELARQVYLSAP